MPTVMRRFLPLLMLVVGVGFGYLFGVSENVSQADVRGKSTLSASAQPLFKAPQKQFIRVSKNAQGEPISLDIAVSEYTSPANASGPRVSLVGAIHIADDEYFRKLNQELERYEVVLYELVAPRNTRPIMNVARGDDPLTTFQNTLADLLDVSHQLEKIDYQRANFVHADLSFDDLVAEGKRRGETQSTLLMGILMDAMKAANKASATPQPAGAQPETVADLLQLLSNPTRLRREFAVLMASGDVADGIPGFTTLTPYLIDMRNKAALEALREEMRAGKKNIAIFYGAAHLPDFERRLIEEFKLQRTETRWISAWDITREIPQKNLLGMAMKLFQVTPSAPPVQP